MTWQAGGYRAEELIGAGRTGEVWRGWEIATGEPVALKRLAAGQQVRREAADDLRREAAVLSALSHPHLLHLRGVVSDADGLILVLDHAAGGSVADLLARRGPVPAGEVVTLLAPIADALTAAHSAGLVHGDVSASNVLLTAEGSPLLADLGTAALLAEDPRPALGTPGFLDPAVAAGGPATPRSDVYALGALAAYALTGSEPDPAAALARLPGTHPLRSVLQRSLHADPDLRPTAQTVAVELRAAVPELPLWLAAGERSRDAPRPALTHAFPPAAAAPAPDAHVTPGRHRSPGAGRPTRRRGGRGIIQIAVGVLVLVLAGAAGLVWGASSTAAPAGGIGARVPTSWTQVWSGLDQRREVAFATADATLLGQVYLAECPALAADLQAIRALARGHAHATGVRHEHAQVRLEATTATTAALLVVDRLQPYEVRDGSGRLIARHPPQPARRLRVRLARTSKGWRIAALSAG
ncbi:MAG: serine/threonine protein kinase [Actinomycetota bacterium]|nr:serine/threonine protein kinase [Actinomycetota bacterium]